MFERPWIASLFLAGSLCPGLGWGDVARSQSPAEAEAPFGRLNLKAPPETAQWGQLAGTWDCTIKSSSPDGSARQGKSRWTWTYILDGHAIQDFYVGYDQDSRPNFYGSGLRIYNPAQGKWEIIWISDKIYPDKAHRITPFEATFQEGQIVMKNVQGGDPAWRTVFYDIGEDRFEWKSTPLQRMTCQRVR